MSHLEHQFIAGRWTPGSGTPFAATNPATGEDYWHGHAATEDEVDRAVAAARAASPGWAMTPLEERVAVVERYKAVLESKREALAQAICTETGKPRWESATEAGAMIGKVPLTFAALEERWADMSFDMNGSTGALRHKPHGVLAVFGPFNLPGHLPNGHIVPAILAGNTIVFKPSEQTPLIGAMMVEAWHEAGLPEGVINLIQGAKDTGVSLAGHHGHDGILFTGSFAVGAALHKALVQTPQRILALELGGNNPLVVHGVSDVDAACLTTIQSAYITAGQRCTDARRLILVEGDESDRFLARLVEMIGGVRVGLPDDEPEPFVGPVINAAAADALLEVQAGLLSRGGMALVEMTRSDRCDALLSPGLIDVTEVSDRADEEHFGPMLQVIRVPGFEAALAEANNTAYGLSASILCDDRAHYEAFLAHTRAGIINWNRPTSGASGRLPFGGVGKSGNHRPSGFYAIDYCGFPVASVEQDVLAMPATLPVGLEGIA